MEIYTTEEYKY